MPSIAILLLAWATGLYSSSTRNARFVLLATAASIAWFAAGFAGPELSGFRLAVAVALALAVLFPQFAFVRSVTPAESRADALLDEFLAGNGSGESDRLRTLDAIRRIVPDDGGRILGARLRLWAAARRSGRSRQATTVPADYLEKAGQRFVKDAQWRRVIGYRPIVTPWDEDMALRGFNEEAQSLLPGALQADKAPVEVGPWAAAVETLLSDLSLAPLRDAVIDSARTKLREAIRAHLEVALGDRSEEATGRQATTAYAMQSSWEQIAEHLQRIRPPD